MYLEHKLESEVVAEAADAHALLARAEAGQPDVVLLDWDLCDRPLEELVSALHQIEGRPGVIIINAPPGSKQSALAAEASVARDQDPKSLLLAIETIRFQREQQWTTSPTTPA
jgi:DNA-binding NarL/FixJ family response regulator